MLMLEAKAVGNCTISFYRLLYRCIVVENLKFLNLGVTNDHISAFWDMLPTFSELTGEPIKGETDGISMLPTLLGKQKKQKQKNASTRRQQRAHTKLRTCITLAALHTTLSHVLPGEADRRIRRHDTAEIRRAARRHR